MVQGHPPSHSKSSQTGITIDLEAERIDPSEPETGDAVAAEERDFTSEEPATARSENTDTGSMDEDVQQEPAAQEPATAAPAQAAPQGSSLGVIAAGIFGGLVALFGAGSIQYAGYLPALGPQAATSTTIEPAADYAADIAALAARLDALPKTATLDLAPVEARLAALETSVAGLAASGASGGPETQAAIKALEDRIASLSSSLSSVSTGLSQAQQKLEAPREEINVARTIAASALKTSIDRGGAFVSELQTLSGVTPDDPNLKKLETWAQTGVLSRADLVATFPGVADSIFAAINAPAPGATLTERLVNSALSLVTVRPVGQVEGQSPEAVLARIEASLQNGDLKAAEVEWKNLPDAGKAAGSDFKTRLDTRITVEALMTGVMTDAVTTQKVQP